MEMTANYCTFFTTLVSFLSLLFRIEEIYNGLKILLKHLLLEKVHTPLKLSCITLSNDEICQLGCRNLTPRQRQLIEEFAKEEQGEYDKGAAAGASR